MHGFVCSCVLWDGFAQKNSFIQEILNLLCTHSSACKQQMSIRTGRKRNSLLNNSHYGMYSLVMHWLRTNGCNLSGLHNRHPQLCNSGRILLHVVCTCLNLWIPDTPAPCNHQELEEPIIMPAQGLQWGHAACPCWQFNCGINEWTCKVKGVKVTRGIGKSHTGISPLRVYMSTGCWKFPVGRHIGNR